MPPENRQAAQELSRLSPALVDYLIGAASQASRAGLPYQKHHAVIFPFFCLCSLGRRATGSASRSRRDEHALCRPRNTTALPGRRWRRVRAVRPPAAHRDRGGTSTRCAARATRPPSPAGASTGGATCGPCLCRRRCVASAAERARAVPLARRDRSPRPAMAEGTRRAAHVCAAGSASRSWRDEHALCRPRDTTTPPHPSRRWRRLAPCGLFVCHRRCVASSVGRARAVPPARHNHPTQPVLAEGVRRAAHVCAAGCELRSRRDEHALCRPRDATALPGPGHR